MSNRCPYIPLNFFNFLNFFNYFPDYSSPSISRISVQPCLSSISPS